MATNVMTTPRFSKNQLVCFVGGVGKILGYRQYAVNKTLVQVKQLGLKNANVNLVVQE